PHSSPRSVARAGHAPSHDRAVSATHEPLRAHVHDHAFLARTVPRVVGPEILVGHLVDEPFAFVVLHPVDHAPHLHIHVGVVGVGRRHRDPVVPLQVLERLSCRGLAELEVLAVPIDPPGAGVWLALGSQRGHVTKCGLAQYFLLLLRKTHALPFFRWCVVQLSSTPPHALGHTATRPRTVERYRARSGLSFPFSQGLWCSIDRRCWWDFQDSALVGLAPSSEKIAFLAAGAG